MSRCARHRIDRVSRYPCQLLVPILARYWYGIDDDAVDGEDDAPFYQQSQSLGAIKMSKKKRGKKKNTFSALERDQLLFSLRVAFTQLRLGF